MYKSYLKTVANIHHFDPIKMWGLIDIAHRITGFHTFFLEYCPTDAIRVYIAVSTRYMSETANILFGFSIQPRVLPHEMPGKRREKIRSCNSIRALLTCSVGGWRSTIPTLAENRCRINFMVSWFIVFPILNPIEVGFVVSE